jgi:hypothetical protein
LLDGLQDERPYFCVKPDGLKEKMRLVGNALCRLLVEALAPWYAMMSSTNGYEVIDNEN